MRANAREPLFAALGHELHLAMVDRKPVKSLTSRSLGLSITDAYAIQEHMLSHRIRAGVPVVGKKIGATSEPVQRLVGIDQPDFGLLLEDCAYSTGARVPYSRLIQPRAEGEIAFYLHSPLKGPGVTPEMVLAATEYISPCIEIVDSRIEGWEIRIVDTIADNASCGVFIVGDDKVSPEGIDLASIEMRLLVNGIEATRGLGSASLGHPANAVAWLANKLGSLGVALEPGEPILSGSLGKLVDICRGDTVTVLVSSVGISSANFS